MRALRGKGSEMNAVTAKGVLSGARGVTPYQGDKHHLHFIAIADYAEVYFINNHPKYTGFSGTI